MNRNIAIQWKHRHHRKSNFIKEKMAMRSKRLLQIFVMLALLFSPIGQVQNAQASANQAPLLEAVVVDRELNFWNATYFGFVSSSMYEKWKFEFTATHSFVITASPILPGLTLDLILLNASGGELATGI